MERLSGLDASFLYLETPQMHMHVAMAALLDPSGMPGGYSFDRIQRLISNRVHRLPPFRRKLVRVPFDLDHPMWVEDPDFDIIHHVRRVACPAPGGRKEFGEICGRINSTPLDRSRPLWEVWVIEGLEDGRVAIVAKVHHAAVDGQLGAQLLVQLFSLNPNPHEEDVPGVIVAEKVPTDGDLVREAITRRIRQHKDMVELARRTVQNGLDVVERRQSNEGPVGATPLTAPRTNFNGAITARRNAAFTRVKLEGIKDIKNAFGCTVNDVVLAISAGALRRYLDGRNELPRDPLIACCPVSVAAVPGRAKGANHVSGMFVSLATHVDDPVERLRVIRSTTVGAKEEHNAIGANMLQSWAEFAAPTTFSLAARFYTRLKLADRHRPVLNLVISNVPGPPFPIYLAGAKLVAAYPMGPVMEGAGLNITVMSYCGSVDFGFMVASNLVPDVWDLADAVHPAFEELLAAAQTHRLKQRSVEEPAPAVD